MAKTGEKAAFSLNEKRTAMVNLPAQFVTASAANKKGQSFSSLVDYANDKNKTSEVNNESITELVDLKDQFKDSGYANRTDAITEKNPIFGRDKLNYNNHDISMLRKSLDEAQSNGNNIHELAFSMRGDWLVENNLYDPETGTIDQNRLKHAEQKVANILINDGFKQPLGESAKDVVWFGAIHQDTDHLNMHLWFAKVSPETRPEMIKQDGPYQGQPKGVIPLAIIEKTKREFRNELVSANAKDKRTEILKGIGHLKKDLVSTAEINLIQDKYAGQIEEIYDALPHARKGRWQVGNTTLTAKNNQMSEANHLTNKLLDQIFDAELNNEYTEFKQLTKQYDAINIVDQGVLRKGQKSFSENKDANLRKRLANGLYRQLNQVDDSDMKPLEQLLQHAKKQHITTLEITERHSQETGLKEKKFDDMPFPTLKSQPATEVNPILGEHDGNHSQYYSLDEYDSNYTQNSSKEKKQLNPLPNSKVPDSKGDQLPSYNHSNSTLKKISRVFQNDIRSEVNAERQFLRNKERERREQQYKETQSSHGL